MPEQKESEAPIGPPTTFAEFRDRTADDLDRVVELIQEVAEDVRQGDMGVFEAFWIEGGTEEGDARIHAIRQMLIFRYAKRHDDLREYQEGSQQIAS